VDAVIKIRSLYDSFSPAQKKLADHILANRGEIPFLSIHDLAGQAGVSVASISRFARVIGFDDIKDLKVQLGREFQTTVQAIYPAIQPEDDDERIIDKVFAGDIRSLADTLKMLNRSDLVKAARRLAAARRVVFFGIGSSGYIAQDAALRFSQLDVQAEAYTETYQMLNQALRTRARDVAVGISHSGRSAITIKALELAVNKGATAVGISNYARSPLSRVAAIFLCTSFPESRVKVAALSSRVAQTGLIDALYLLTARHMTIRPGRTEELNAYTEDLVRVPPR